MYSYCKKEGGEGRGAWQEERRCGGRYPRTEHQHRTRLKDLARHAIVVLVKEVRLSVGLPVVRIWLAVELQRASQREREALAWRHGKELAGDVQFERRLKRRARRCDAVHAIEALAISVQAIDRKKVCEEDRRRAARRR